MLFFYELRFFMCVFVQFPGSCNTKPIDSVHQFVILSPNNSQKAENKVSDIGSLGPSPCIIFTTFHVTFLFLQGAGDDEHDAEGGAQEVRLFNLPSLLAYFSFRFRFVLILLDFQIPVKFSFPFFLIRKSYYTNFSSLTFSIFI